MAITRPASWLAALALAVTLPLSAAGPARAETGQDPGPTPPAGISDLAADPVADGPVAARAADPMAAEQAADVAEEPSLSIYGWVVDSYSTDPLPGVKVAVWQSHTIGVEPFASAVTGEDGFYAISDLEPGEYRVHFSRDGFFEEWWDDAGAGSLGATLVTVTDDEPWEASAELSQQGSVTGVVTTSSGRPVAGKWMTLFRWLEAEEYWAEGDAFTTNSKGQFSFPELRPGTYAVVGEALPKGAKVAMTGHFVGLLSYSGNTNGGIVSPWIKGAPGIGIRQEAVAGYGWRKTTFSYRWLRDKTTIPNATGASYTPGAADLHSQLQVRVTARQGSNTFTVVSPTSWPLLQTSAPTIIGTVAVGDALTAKPGQWEEGTKLAYQWYADGKAISGGTKQTLTLTGSHKAKRITVRVTGTYAEFPVLARTSAATAKVATAGTPSVSGNRIVGDSLKAKTGTWTKSTKFTYQWLRNGVAIPKATKSSYKLTSADAGKSVTVKVTGRRSGYATVSRTSADAPLVILAGAPTITGIAGTGETLTAKPGTWSAGAAFSYQWYASGKAISGATTNSLVLTGSQAGKQITVRVTGRLDGYATASKTSKATVKVLRVGTVSITGTPTAGSVLTARAGTWTSKAKLTYQWSRNGVALSGATRSSYRLQAADVGTTVSVRVTGKRSGYATVSTTAALEVPAPDPAG